MSRRYMSGTEQGIRTVLALIVLGFSFQERTSLIQAIVGYVVSATLLLSVWIGRSGSR
jgi:hypothetical protein